MAENTPVEGVLYEHVDGRHAVALTPASAVFAAGDPQWHRVGPVALPAPTTPTVDAAVAQEPKTAAPSSREMFDILDSLRFEVSEYTDCAILYTATFDKLQSLYRHALESRFKPAASFGVRDLLERASEALRSASFETFNGKCNANNIRDDIQTALSAASVGVGREAHLDLLQDVLDAKDVMRAAGIPQGDFPTMFAAFAASTQPLPRTVAAPSDEEILHIWDSFVGDPTAKLPLSTADKTAFARAVLARWAAAPVRMVDEPATGRLYVAARECLNCCHVGMNDESDTNAACNACDWTGPSPLEDHCPGCNSDGTMTAACPKCGERYGCIAEDWISLATPPQHAAAGAVQGDALSLTLEEKQAVLDGIGIDHDGTDFEAECPHCTAYQKVAAAIASHSTKEGGAA